MHLKRKFHLVAAQKQIFLKLECYCFDALQMSVFHKLTSISSMILRDTTDCA